LTLVFVSAANAVMLPGGGSKRTDCIAELATTGSAFPVGRRLPVGVIGRLLRGGRDTEGVGEPQTVKDNGVSIEPKVPALVLGGERKGWTVMMVTMENVGELLALQVAQRPHQPRTRSRSPQLARA
jgi:hypothetical protein